MRVNTGINPFKGDQDERKASVKVKLRNGHTSGPWLAHTSRWSLTGDPFDIMEWEKV